MDQRIEETIFYITKNYYKPLVLDDICASVNLSKFHFHRMFRSQTGMTPLQFWHQIRLQHAQHYALQYPNSKQLEVAFMCGYVSPPIFARAFQKQMGMSMIKFRNQALAETEKHQIDERIVPFDIVYLTNEKGINSKKEEYSISNRYYLKLKFKTKLALKKDLNSIIKIVEEQFSQVKVEKGKAFIIKGKSNIAYYSLRLK